MPATANRTSKNSKTANPSIGPSTQAAYLRAAAVRWGVPYEILLGVYGAESSFGTNPAAFTSNSAGAQGPFEFLPATAAQYHVTDRNSFSQEAEAAAHLLHDLHQSTGSWDAALQHYSGGAYGLAHVQQLAGTVSSTPGAAAKLASFLPDIPNIPGSPFVNPFGNPLDPSGGGGAIPGTGPSSSDPLGGILNWPSSVVDAFKAGFAFLQMLTDPHFYLRVGEVIAGLVLIHMGLKELSGGYASQSAGVRRAGGRVAEVGLAAAA